MHIARLLLLFLCKKCHCIFMPLLLLWFHSQVYSQSHVQEVMQLKGAEIVSASGYLQMLRDPSGQMDAEDAMARTAWQHLPGTLSAGYSEDALWLRLSVQRDEKMPHRWFLSFGNALLDDVRLYQRNPDGRWVKVAQAGDAVPRQIWPVDARSPLLPFNVSEIKPEQLLIRVKTRNAISLRIEVSTPELQTSNSSKESFFYGMGLGFGLFITIFHLLFWLKSRDPVSGWYAAYASCLLFLEWINSGLFQQFLGISAWISDPLLWLVMCASLPVTAMFSSIQLNAREHFPWFHRCVISFSIVVGAISAIFVLLQKIENGMMLMQSASLLGIFAMLVLAICLLQKESNNARKFLMVFGIYYAGVAVAFLRNFGVLPNTSFTMNSVAIGALLHMMVMSFRMIHEYEKMRNEKESAQSNMVSLIGAQNENLEKEVYYRTGSLQAEILRRELLEIELRNAIELERKANQSQLDFVSLVSHEFRTPLAIINTTAQQIARNLNAGSEKTLLRCENIRNAVKRMQVLVDEYLDNERMQMDINSLMLQDFRKSDLHRLIESLINDWPEGRVLLIEHSTPEMLQCDPGLIRVALRNLVANADRHAPRGTQVTVDLSMDGSEVFAIRVKNSGPAIPQNEIPNIFEKFFRGSLTRGMPGAGLGLHIVRQIAEMHSGTIELESSGHHAMICFCLKIPCAADSVAPGHLRGEDAMQVIVKHQDSTQRLSSSDRSTESGRA